MSAVQPNFDAAQIAFDPLRLEFLIRAILKDARTAIPVQVVAVHPGTGSPPAIGTVDVQPLVQTVDGSGKLWSMAEVYGASFSRVQSGSTAFILDPSVGDIGLATVCDRDISSVIAAGGIAGPGSARTHDISDLVYQFTIISSAITQYLQMTASLLKAVFPNINLNGVTISSSGTLAAPVLQSGNGATGSGNNVTVVDGIVTSVS
jgi:Phage protein Gp138 N-terminal domain